MSKGSKVVDKKRLYRIKEEIISLIADIVEGSKKDVRKIVKTNFIKGSNLDSLIVLEIISALEKTYKVEIEEKHFPRLGNIGDMAMLIDELTTVKEQEKTCLTNAAEKKMLKNKKPQ